MSCKSKTPKTSKTPEAHKIQVYVMNRCGDTRSEADAAEAEEIARTELLTGKWLRLVNENGNTTIVRTADDLDRALEKNPELFEGVGEMYLMAALVGGR